MPQADPVTVRIAANRAAAVATELQRLRDQLSGATAKDGWTGSARLAFDETMASRLSLFGPVIDRYDGYAAALITYARALEQTLPALRDARLKLDNAPRGPNDSGPNGDELDFNRLWQDWDEARRRCSSALGVAGRIGADRHGLSALWHSATHLAHEVVSHVNLAEVSKALSELGDVLFVAALVLSPVPGLGEALWAAVSIVAVAKFAVDGARFASGDKTVSKGDLAWDAVGALPGGKMSKSAREAAGLEKTITVSKKVEGLASDATKVNIVPGGGLMTYEGARGFGGHTIRKHVGKSYDYLVGRFKSGLIFRSSSFVDRATAEHVISGALAHADEDIRAWQKSGVPTLFIRARSDKEVGVTISRFGKRVATPTKNFRVILERHPQMPLGYRIPTAHPTP